MKITDADNCKIAYEKHIQEFADTVRNSKVLDIGCGRGDYTKYFCKDNNKVIGIDIEDWRADEFSDYFKFIKYDGIKIPFNENEFNVVISFDVIEHVRDDLNFAEEIRRVLKQGGRLFLATPNRKRLSNLLFKLVGKPIKYPLTLTENGFLGKLVHIREYTNSELSDLFMNSGFKNIHVENFWFGLRGKVNLGINNFFIKSISQYLFLRGK